MQFIQKLQEYAIPKNAIVSYDAYRAIRGQLNKLWRAAVYRKRDIDPEWSVIYNAKIDELNSWVPRILLTEFRRIEREKEEDEKKEQAQRYEEEMARARRSAPQDSNLLHSSRNER
jgi:hypothetical protein